METLHDEHDLFGEKEPTPLVAADDVHLSESDLDDDDFSSHGDDALDHLNVSSNLKNILRMGGSDTRAVFDGEDSESDDDTLQQKLGMLDLDKINEKLAKSKSKFKDFGAQKEEEEEEEEVVMKRKRSKKPQEKKRRRDKGKEKMDILLEQEEARADRLKDVLSRFRAEDDDDDDLEEEDRKIKKKQKKKSGRKSRKNVSTEGAIDENGERMIRTTSLLDDSSSSSEDEKPLSKKQEEEMYKENERLRRNKKIGLKPVYNIKSFDDFVKRRDEKEEQYLKQQTLEKQKPSIPLPQANDDSDSDIEIIGDPKKIAAQYVSPDRARYPIMSPVNTKSQTSYKEFNRRMLEKITNQGYEYRMKMEAAARAKGQYASATERAKRLLEREKDALMINQQINQHFEKQKQNQVDLDSDEEDEDYEEGGGNDDIFNELSGSEEEFEVEDADETSKRKLSDDEQSDKDYDEDDMGVAAFKRWKNKKMKKSIFDEDDEDDIKATKKKSAPRPEPKHSIANFFKSKEKESDDKPEETDEPKALNRLVQKATKMFVVPQPESEETVERDDASNDDMEDDMDVDENIPKSSEKRPTLSNPKGKLEYLEEEAEEEEDEFFGAGGEDGEGDENLDEFEKDDLLVEDNNEHVDEAALREAFNKQDEESDKHLIQRLITDITGGGLRKQKAAAEAGLMLEDVDLYDEEDNDLVAIRRLQAERRRKLLKMRGGDTLENLLKDPKTAAFAKAFQAIPDEPIVILSDEEGEPEPEPEQEQEEEKHVHVEEEQIKVSKRIIIEDDEDEDDEKDILEDFSDEDDLVISEMDEMATPLRGELLGLDDDDEDIETFQVETMRSPVAVRKAKSIFSSPSNMDRFKRLIAEASNAVNGTTDSGGPRIGFGAVKNFK